MMTKEQRQEAIEKFAKQQADHRLHPYTCGRNSNHRVLVLDFDSDGAILRCPDCDYSQPFRPRSPPVREHSGHSLPGR